jgi:hypothetical protein
MKKILILFIVTLGVTLMSCKKLDEMNIDPKNPAKVPASFLFSNAMRNLVDQETITSVNFNVFRAFAQYWTETTYPDESNYDITTRQIPDREFRVIYRDVLANLKEAKRVVPEAIITSADAPAIKNNMIACTEILSVYAFQREVDIFGNVPYSKSLDITNILPAYDDAQTIYSNLFDRLDAAISSINTSSHGFADGDLMYNGDMSKWKTFANSLKLKLAINVADVSGGSPALDPGAKAAAAVTAGVMTSSADNATFPYLAESPSTNPIWVDLVQSGRYDWVPANTIVDIMNTLNDPRRPLYFDNNLGAGVYTGGIYGENNSYADFTHITPTIQAPDWRGLLMSYSEIEFYLAEAAARGWAVGGTDASFYDAAITTSIVDDWGGTTADALAYIAQPSVNYATASGTYKEKIGTQSWIASYDRGLLGWTTWRRLDAPTLNLPAQSGNPVPTRYTYPATEQTLNGSNYSTASAAIGGDTQTTKIFWDKF